MIRSYLRYVQIIEMTSRRLTKTQKAEILEAYQSGDSTNIIAENYNCTPNTIIRTVKNFLSESEYIFLKKNRMKNSNKNEKLDVHKIGKDQLDGFKEENSLIEQREKTRHEDLKLNANENLYSSELADIDSSGLMDNDSYGCLISDNTSNGKLEEDENNQNSDNTFQEIIPLISSLDFDNNNKQSDFEILKYENLPESVYMIVDKKVELELQPISGLPEWSFLPDNELQRNAILLFTNQRSAKRLCSKSQRVIKIPNTRIFKLSKSYLIAKGITRLILEDSIIGLDY